MCTVCGCGNTQRKPYLQMARSISHAPLHYGNNAAGVSVPGLSVHKVIELEQAVLGRNDEVAAKNRAAFVMRHTAVLNLVSSPGSGKTTLLAETLKQLFGTLPLAVIEGDQQTSFDAERIAATGVAAIQVNTGKGCHLDALMVRDAMTHLPTLDHGLLFIENVGNLVCPAGFDLGEAHKVVLLSVTEGEDKPLKYPDMFHAADIMLLTKMDLVPYTDFDVERCLAYARQVNPDLVIFKVSARSGAGMTAWLQWLRTFAADTQGHSLQTAEKRPVFIPAGV